MMKYIDIRLRVPAVKLGLLLTDFLPYWAQVMGLDKLVEEGPPSEGNGEYRPQKGSAAEAVLRTLSTPMRAMDVVKRLEGRQKEKAVLSAIQALKGRGLIRKNEDQTYAKS